MVLMFVGWAGNARKMETEAQLKAGETLRVKNYTIRLDELVTGEDSTPAWQPRKVFFTSE